LNLLAIDTSSDWLQIALKAEGEIRLTTLKSKNRHSDFLMSEIDHVMRSANFSVEKLDAIGCVTGPGHFTGIRSGMASVKAMAFACSLKVIGLTYPECFRSVEPVVLLRRARKGWWYFSEFNGESWDYSLKPSELLPKFLSGKKSISEEEIENVNSKVVTGPIFTGFDMLEAMEKSFKKGKNVYDHVSVDPFYVQRPVAEEKLNERKRGEL